MSNKMVLRYWQSLLIQWRKIGGDGLTLPFLIGSQTYFIEKAPLMTIADLLDEIASNQEIEVYIGYCMGIDEIIIGLRDDSKEKNAGQFVTDGKGNISKIFLTRFLRDLGDNVSDISSALSEKYQGYIANGKYSVESKEWSGFSAKDLTFINEVTKTLPY